jgi:hypothetical protein
MSDDKQPNDQDKSRRFRITRKVKPTPKDPETYAEQVMRELPTDEADPGTKGMQFEVGQGCMGCFWVTLLVIVIMLVSIVATWFIRRQGV